jgi:hypothetical protein
VASGPPPVAPFRGREGRFLTNPICIAIPGTDNNEPVLLDFATSRVAMGKVRVAHNAGKPMLDGALLRPRSHVDEVQRHHSRPRGNLAIGPDAANMVRIAQPIHRNTMFLRRLNCPFDRLPGDYLAVAGTGIPYRNG